MSSSLKYRRRGLLFQFLSNVFMEVTVLVNLVGLNLDVEYINATHTLGSWTSWQVLVGTSAGFLVQLCFVLSIVYFWRAGVGDIVLVLLAVAYLGYSSMITYFLVLPSYWTFVVLGMMALVLIPVFFTSTLYGIFLLYLSRLMNFGYEKGFVRSLGVIFIVGGMIAINLSTGVYSYILYVSWPYISTAGILVFGFLTLWEYRLPEPGRRIDPKLYRIDER